MKRSKIKAAIGIFLLTLLVGISGIGGASAKTGSQTTVGLWHLDELKPSGDTIITVDSASFNNGIVGTNPEPEVVEGKFDKAFSFNGISFVYVPISFLIGFPPSAQPIYMPISQNLKIQNEIKLDAWVNVQEFTNATYNSVIVFCTRDDASWYSIKRVAGLAIRGLGFEDGVSVAAGCLSGFLRTASDEFNEVVTTEPVIPIGEWVHVAFTRTASGLHLYVDGQEQDVTAIHGKQKPVGKIMNGTEVYFGHDAKMKMDEASIIDLAPEVEDEMLMAIDIGPNIAIVVVSVALIFAVAWLLRRAIQMRVIHSRSS